MRSQVATLAVGALLVAVGCGSSVRPADAARAAANSFLDRYVASDGRVIRLDQGGDTVSEGQAYGLLLAEADGRTATFARIWTWTRTHLQRADGLLAYHADADGVLDEEPAADADLLTAWALTRYRGPDRLRYVAAGERIARALLANELAYPSSGEAVLAAGPWATPLPATLDPSYFSPLAFAGLNAVLPDGRWSMLERQALAVSGSLTNSGTSLPPDWATLDADGTTAPAPAPNRSPPASVQYGLDAQRLVVWFAASCNQSARALARGWWSILKQPGRAGATALSQSGDVLDSSEAPLPFVAAAAAADAAGDTHDRDRLLSEAEQLDERSPTYYGSAWVALGRILLTTKLLGGCG